MKSTLLSWLFFFAFLLPLAAQNEVVRGNGWEAVKFMKSEGILIVYYYENKPFIYKDSEGNLQGIEYDLLQQFRNYLKSKHNVQIRLVWKRAETTDEFHKAVTRGDRGSIGIGAVTITEDKQEDLKYSPAYMSDISVIITSDEVATCENIDVFRESFRKKRAVTIKNSNYEKYFSKLTKIILPNLELQYVRNNDQIVETVLADKNTFGYVQLPSYLLSLKEGDKIKRHRWFMESNDSGYGFILPTKTAWDEPLKEFFNHVNFKDSVKAITTKYLGADISEFVTELQDNNNTETRSGEGNEISVLEKENVIKQDRLQQKEVEAIEAKNTQYKLMFLVLFILMAATVFYVRYQTKQKANSALAKLNEELMKKNEEAAQQAEEILQQNEEINYQKNKLEKLYDHTADSIRYAKRIQESILPDKKVILASLPASFIYFNPKDELSGDFYWFAQKEHLKILISIDCTGHGVPGAFMTVMANTLLNHVILEYNITNPEQILTEIDKGVQENMNKQGGDGKRKMHDGMDMAICAIDEQKQEITFASANQSMCHISNNELIHIKGSSFPVGGFQFDQKKYENTVISYQKGDMFYMYSDGYQDQFGGINGRKYMSKKFRQFLLQICHLEPEAQETILRREIQSWRGTRVQTDDQMVIGFRL
jgi:serine phosphatase RsbU (regulator of sigma subunit)